MIFELDSLGYSFIEPNGPYFATNRYRDFCHIIQFTKIPGVKGPLQKSLFPENHSFGLFPTFSTPNSFTASFHTLTIKSNA